MGLVLMVLACLASIGEGADRGYETSQQEAVRMWGHFYPPALVGTLLGTVAGYASLRWDKPKPK